ncbi:MAG: potassium channel family protein [Gammaproteobacteria bacterium]
MAELASTSSGAGLYARCVQLVDRQRCSLLFVSLVMLLILYPYLDGDDDALGLLLEIITSVVLLVGLYSISRKTWEFITAVVLIIPALVGNWSDARANDSLLELIMVFSEIAFFLFMTAMIFAYVMGDRLLLGDRLQGALSVYLLLGVMFSLIYELMEMLAPGSLRFPNDAPIWSDYLYYSFVTLTTLGYGEIVPVTPKAQSLAILEAATGVLYVAVLVAWLVSALRAPGSAEDSGRQIRKGA